MTRTGEFAGCIGWWAFSGAAAVCCVFSLAVSGLWVRGWHVGDDLMMVHVARGEPCTSLLIQAWSSAGGLRVVVQEERSDGSVPVESEVPYPPDWTQFGAPGWHVSYCNYAAVVYPVDTLSSRRVSWGGIEWVSDGSASGVSHSLTLPDWLIVLILSAVPLSWVVAVCSERRAAARARAGLCRRCGYDLRATHGRCPECGQGY